MTNAAIKKADNNTDPGVILELLSTVASTNIDADNLEEILTNAASVIAEYLDSTYCLIMLKDKQGCLSEVFGDNDTDLDPEQVPTDALINKVMDTGTAMTIASTTPITATSLCAPLCSTNSTSGVIYAQGSSSCKWDHNTLKTMELIGLYIGMVVSNMDLKEHCEQNEKLAMAGRATLELSHSVKNILQMVSGAAEVIDLGLKTDQLDRVERSWSILKPNLDRLRKFMLDMLSLSKERPLELCQCDFNKIIQDAIESLKAQLKQKLSQLNMQIDQKIPMVELDSERILEMSLNIILNAVDIVCEENGIVCVETHYLKDTQMIELKVTDNGPGMNDEMKAKLFTPFESGKNKFGTGLGMAIAKRIIDQHGGEIDVITALGKGTTISIQLPANIIE